MLGSLRPLRRDWWQRGLHLTHVKLVVVLTLAELIRGADSLLDARICETPGHVLISLLLQEYLFIGIFNHLSAIFMVAQILPHFLKHVSLGYFSRHVGIRRVLVTVGLLAVPVLELIVISEPVEGLSAGV